MSAEITEATGEQVKLIAGGGGIFEVRQDGKVLWEKVSHGVFPKPGEAAWIGTAKNTHKSVKVTGRPERKVECIVTSPSDEIFAEVRRESVYKMSDYCRLRNTAFLRPGDVARRHSW